MNEAQFNGEGVAEDWKSPWGTANHSVLYRSEDEGAAVRNYQVDHRELGLGTLVQFCPVM